jgi:aspartoacylase
MAAALPIWLWPRLSRVGSACRSICMKADVSQTGFLVERWPCGLVIEVGPVPQGVIQAPICRHTQLALEAALAVSWLRRARDGLRLPRQSGDPSPSGQPRPAPQCRWHPPGLPPSRSASTATGGRSLPAIHLFLDRAGHTLCYDPPAALAAEVVPVFVNEAAYGEKGIALSLTRREELDLQPAWGEALLALAAPLATGAPAA